ncbi:hypothetical protein PR048_006512 [Dryococelus australis]|uniref:Uncharacterized protein n=1 Tax=Dryococelus australis TaxID=614101 RepID=A0ABQ9IBA1_9NEOP|nr:hypothetical protein PR048_006512 [Dryococelus australis]
MEQEKLVKNTDSPVEPISSCRDECGYVPTVGRWGCEWPNEWAELTGECEWPEGHPLPLPSWGNTRQALEVPSVECYEELASHVELTVQQLLQVHHYNSVGNLIRFYEEFHASGFSDVMQFFRQYSPPITPEHYTCVGLALELLRRLASLEEKFPGLTSRLYLVSCEEQIDDLDCYHPDEEPDAMNSAKEHVMVALRVTVAGRPGILLSDPGYHIARVVTIMSDGLYPHTGWFTQSDEPTCRKEYHYSALSSDNDYIVWRDRETRAGREKNTLGVIYVARPYLTPINVTERRNLLYNLCSLLARDAKGHLIAGIYFKIDYWPQGLGDAFFNMIYQVDGETRKVKIPFVRFFEGRGPMDDTSILVAKCCRQLSWPEGKLEATLTSLAKLLADESFRTQLLDLNHEIETAYED